VPANIGNQTVTILFYRPANSSIVNKRFQGIRQTGIYSGGYLSVVDNTTAQISTLVCEISDGTYQVRIETASTVNLTVAEGTPYIVLRWAYTGTVTDYMELLAVATPAANDLVVGKCTFVGGNLNGFNYQDSSYPRTTPSTQDLFLKVEPTETSERRVRIRAGRIQTNSAVIDISDQKSDLFDTLASNSRIDLIYINKSTGAVEIETGVAALNPVVPDYKGKIVLAEITLTAGYTNITASMIKDVRNFISPNVSPDDVTIEENSDGKLQVKSIGQALSAVGSTNVNTKSLSYTDMPDMSIAITTMGGKVFVTFTCEMIGDSSRVDMYVKLVRGSTKLSEALYRNKNYEGSHVEKPFTLQYLDEISAGTYVYKIQWHTGGEHAPANGINQQGVTYPRVLVVQELS